MDLPARPSRLNQGTTPTEPALDGAFEGRRQCGAVQLRVLRLLLALGLFGRNTGLAIRHQVWRESKPHGYPLPPTEAPTG